MHLYFSNQFILLVFFIILNPYIKSIMLNTYHKHYESYSNIGYLQFDILIYMYYSTQKIEWNLNSESETLRRNDPVYWFTEWVSFKHYLIDETKSTVKQKGSIQVGLGSIHIIWIIGICCDFCCFRSLRQLPNTVNLISASVFLQFRFWI